MSAGGFTSVALDDQRPCGRGAAASGGASATATRPTHVPTHLESVTDDGLPTAAVAAEQHSAVVGGAGGCWRGGA